MYNWSDFTTEVKVKSKEGEVVAFVHYSGHGCTVKNDPTN